MPVSTDMVEGGVAVITMSTAASQNTFSTTYFMPLLTNLEEVMANPSCRSVVITGTGDFFSSGGNIDDFSDAIDKGDIGQKVQEMTGRLHPLLLKIRTSEKVFVCAMNGSAFFRPGLSPDGGTTWLLPRLVGNQIARKFFFNSEVWSAEQALEYGAVDELSDSEQLMPRSIEVAREWGKWALSSRKGTKQLLDASTSTFFETQLQFEQSLMVASSQTKDFVEGVRSFKNRVEPSFNKSEEE